MRTYRASRAELFERLDRSALRPLPAQPFAFGTWQLATVNIDYHVEIDRHYYSVPHTFIGEKTDVRVSATTVEIFHRGVRVIAHARSFQPGRHTTLPEHMPSSHRAHSEWTPSRFLRWSQTIGPATRELVDAILQERRHPEQGYRSCLGILRLAKRYGPERLEAACVRGVAVRARSYKHIDAILKHGLDRMPPVPTTSRSESQPVLPLHENVRGAAYYTKGEIEC
jgi:transposase